MGQREACKGPENYQTRQSLVEDPGCSCARTAAKRNRRLGGRKCETAGQHTATQIYEVSIDSKDYHKVIADARRKFAKGLGPAMTFMMR